MENPRGRNWLKWLGLSMVLLIASFQLFAWVFLEPLLETTLRSHVQQASKGQYSIGEVSVDVDVIRGNILLKNLTLISDTTQLPLAPEAGHPPKGTLHFYIAELQFNGINGLAAYKNRRLDVRQISLKQPRLVLPDFRKHHDSAKPDTSDFAPGRLLAGIFTSLQVGSVEVVDGVIAFAGEASSAHTIQGIYLRSRDWVLDNETRDWGEMPGRAVLEINENDYSFLFPSSGAMVKAGKISYDIQNGEFLIRGLQYAPDYQNAAALNGDRQRTEIAVADLVIAGVELSDLLAGTVRQMDRVSLVRPVMRVFSARAGTDRKAARGWEMPAILDEIHVRRLEVSDGEITWFRVQGDSLGESSVKQLSLVIEPSQTDSAQSDVPMDWLANARIDIQTGAYRFSLPFLGYLLTGESVNFSSESGGVLIRRMAAYPIREIMGGATRSVIDEIHVPEIEITGWNPFAFWENPQRTWERVVLREPVIQLTGNFESYPPANPPPTRRGNYWQIDQLLVENGTIMTPDYAEQHAGIHQFVARGVFLDIAGIRMGQGVPPGGLLPLDLRSLHYQLHLDSYRYLATDSSLRVSMDSVTVSGRDSLITGGGAQLSLAAGKGRNAADTTGLQLLSVAVKGWQLAGFRPLDLLRNRQLLASRLTLRTPDLQMASSASQKVSLDSVLEQKSRWKNLYPLLAPTLHTVALGELEIEAGYFLDLRHLQGKTRRIEFPEYDLRLGDIRIDSVRHADRAMPFYFTDIFFALKNYSIAFGDSLHHMKVGKMGISSLARLVYFSDIELRYDSTVLTQSRMTHIPNLYRADVPLISLEQVDLFEAIRTRRLDVGEIFIHGPHAELNSFPAFQEAIIDSLDAYKVFERPDLYAPISGILDALVVERFRLGNGTFLFNTQNDATENGFTSRNISVDIRNFVIDSTAQRRTDRYFYADSMNVGINVSDYTFMTPDSAYMITVGNIGVMSATEQIYVDSIYLLPRVNAPGGGSRLRGFVPRVVLEGLDIKKAYFDKKIDARKLEIQRPELTQYLHEVTNGTPMNRDSLQMQLYRALSAGYHSVRLEQIDVQGGHWQQVKTENQDSSLMASFSGLFARGKGFLLDSAALKSGKHFLFANNWTLGIRHYKARTADSLYLFQLDRLAIETGSHELLLDSLRLIPRYPRYEFAWQKGEWTDRIELELPRMRVSRLNLDSLLVSQKLIAGRLDVAGLDVRVFKDKRLPEPEVLQPKMLLEHLRSLPLFVHIDTLTLNKSYMEYAEQVPEAEEPGVFWITDLSARIFPFSNDPKILGSNTVMQINTRSKVMGAGNMRLRFQYPLNDPQGRFRFEGEIDSMDLADFNPMIAQTAFFQVNTGLLRSMQFQIDADQIAARGKVRFYYNDLKVSFLANRKRDDDDIPDPRRFASFLANTFVVKSDNPTRRFLRVGKIYFERNDRRSIFNYWAHAALSGVKASIGAKNDKDKDKTAGWARKNNPH